MAIRILPRSPYWYAKFYIDGKCIEKSTRVPHEGRERNKARAKAVEAQLKQELIDAKNREAIVGPTVLDGEAFDIKRAQAKGAAQVTLSQSIGVGWRLLKEFFTPHRPLASITVDDLYEYMEWRRKNSRGKITCQTLYRETSALKRAMNYYDIEHKHWPVLGRDPVHSTKKGKERTQEELDLFFAHLKADHGDIFKFALLTAMRAEEIARVEKSWVNGDYLELPASGTKKRKARNVFLVPRAKEILERAFNARGDRPWGPTIKGGKTHYVKQVSCIANKLCRKLKIYPNIHLRDMRHTFATSALQRGNDLKAVMEALGHSDLNAASRYQSAHPQRIRRMASIVDEAYFGDSAKEGKSLVEQAACAS